MDLDLDDTGSNLRNMTGDLMITEAAVSPKAVRIAPAVRRRKDGRLL